MFMNFWSSNRIAISPKRVDDEPWGIIFANREPKYNDKANMTTLWITNHCNPNQEIWYQANQDREDPNWILFTAKLGFGTPWISLAQELPEYGEHVLLCWKYSNMPKSLGMLCHRKEPYFLILDTNKTYDARLDQIDYWMKIPQTPKSKD